jgi:ribosome-binding factor A
VSGDYPRSHRVADFIQRELSVLIRGELKDPRLSPMLTIASVEVSRDLSVARVYYSVLDAEDRQATQEALASASGFLRKQLARRMQIRSVPQLRFHYDDSAEHGARMSALIADAVSTNTTADDDHNASTESGDIGKGANDTSNSETDDSTGIISSDRAAPGGS